jgi:branched-subunit amino acid aminotransferase/4-amino-4-deoxychorismate lyase
LELIETLRWHEPGDGFVRLAGHLARMENSARVFGLSFDRSAAQAALEKAVMGKQGLLRLRLTLNEAGRHHATAHDLAPNPPHWTYAISPERTDSSDLFLRHKTSWRDLYENEAKRLGTDEAIFLNGRGEITEGARSNIFVSRDDILLTPPLEAGVLDGRLRAELIAQGKAREARLTPGDLTGEVYFGNSLRGLIPAKRV